MKRYLLSMVLLAQSFVFADEYCKALHAYKADDFARSRQSLDPLAFRADTRAQNLLGLLNLEEKKNSAGQKWLQNAAVKGDSKAAYNLGVYYYALGQIRQAEKWMHKAEKLTQAKAALGFLYTMKDMSKAKSYFSLAAQEGNAFAKSHLCAIVASRQTAADNQYRGLCRGDVSEDFYVTGRFYISPKQYGSLEKAIYYLNFAAQKGHVRAMNLLGEMLYKRRGPSDEEKALEYFRRASSLGNIDAKVNAAWIYYVGKRWTRKPKQGFIQLNEAYQKGHAKAQFYMGMLKIRGFAFSYETVKKDIAGGIFDIKRAAAKNDPEALQYLIRNHPGLPEIEAYQKALRLHYKDEEQSRALNFLYDEC